MYCDIIIVQDKLEFDKQITRRNARMKKVCLALLTMLTLGR